MLFRSWDQLLEQMYFIGIRSQVVVLTTGAFTGAVFAAQVWFQFKRFGMESAIGSQKFSAEEIGLVDQVCRSALAFSRFWYP